MLEKGVVMWKYLSMLLVLLLVVPGAVLAMDGYGDMPSEKPVINKVKGDVRANMPPETDWIQASVGLILNSGDSVKTYQDSRCEIYHAGGSMRLYPNSLVVIPELISIEDKTGIKRVELNEGAGIFRVPKKQVNNGFEVQTRHVIAGVKGTIFSVENILNGTTVAVYRGYVLVTDPDRSPDTETSLGPGQSVTVVNGKGFGVISGFEPGDDWRGWRYNEKPMLMEPASTRGDDEGNDKTNDDSSSDSGGSDTGQ